jgi:hypothetical protein
MSREPVLGRDKQFVEIAFRRIDQENLKPDEWEKLKSIEAYFKLDGCLSDAQVDAVKKLKLKHDLKEREKRQFNSHLNRDRRLDTIYNPAKPF